MGMKIIVRLTALALGMCYSSVSFAAAYPFIVEAGEVSIQPAFCPPANCDSWSGNIEGTFTAEINEDAIYFSDIHLVSIEGFELPQNPNLDSNGTLREVSFDFDGSVLQVTGKINSSAFDGPITNYHLSARVGESATQFQPEGYYFVTPDYRRCAAPMCGGVWLSAVNNTLQRCGSGHHARSCYVGDVDWSGVGENPLGSGIAVLAQGALDKTVGGFGLFLVERAYLAAGKTSAYARLYGIENNGRVCVSSPCFSYDQYRLNSQRRRALSSVNLEYTNADKAQRELAWSLLAEGQVLIAGGYARRTHEMTGVGREFVATALFLPITKPDKETVCPEGYTETDAGCATRHACFYPELELETLSGAAIEDLTTGVRVANISYSCVTECETPAELVSSGYCRLALP